VLRGAPVAASAGDTEFTAGVVKSFTGEAQPAMKPTASAAIRQALIKYFI